MKTIVAKVDSVNPEKDEEIFIKAASVINNGGLVAFPTETVYGLGANALDPIAVKKIYKAKGRPSDNPLIVHISSLSELKEIASDVPEKSKKLIEAFWPGPITVIFKKRDLIPAEVSGGLSTVAVRFPKNRAARFFIEKCGVPIAAPSANSSGKPSPTRVEHVKNDLDSKIDMILDGGKCEFGLESTVIDVSEETPCLLRPGSVTRHMIESVIGEIKLDKAVLEKLDENECPKAPGMKYKHYSPAADVKIVKGNIDKVVNKINYLISENEVKNIKTGVIATRQTKDLYKCDNILIIGDRDKPEQIASNLFEILRKCDYFEISEVFVEAFDEDGVGMAVMNRLKKAAGYNIINV